MNISKSRFIESQNCPKILWLNLNRIEEKAEETESQIVRMNIGTSVGALAREYFGEYELVDFPYDEYSNKLSKTQELLEKNSEIIAEATFLTDGICCSVDILRKTEKGYDLIEVKSVNNLKGYYHYDIAFQYHVLKSCGLNIEHAYLMHLNGDYVRWGELDLQQLFRLDDVTDSVIAKNAEITDTVKILQEVAAQELEPEIEMGSQCENFAYGGYCPYYDYCHQNEEVPEEVAVEKFERINKDEIANFLEEFSYPIYFLDFETYMAVIPPYDGLKPLGQTPFQYSLHILHENGELEHKEYLGYPDSDPRVGLIKQMCDEIPLNACVVAYFIPFERTRLKELAYFAENRNDLQHYAEHLRNIWENMIDLIVPFKKKYYENEAMEGRSSIKLVLPALFPDDPELNYHNLEGVQNGTDAMTIFPLLTTDNYTPEEIEVKRRQLLKYCKLDTYAMVKIFQKLNETIS